MKSNPRSGGKAPLAKQWWHDEISKLETGQHVSYMFHSDVEREFVLSLFITQGLKRGQRVVYIADTLSARTVLPWIWRCGLKGENYIASHQFKILKADGTYLPKGTFDPDKMIDRLYTEAVNAVGEGYSALRITGEMTWALRGAPGSDRLLEYESRVTPLLASIECLAMCQYDKRQFDTSFLKSVIQCHPVRFGTAG